MFLVINNLPKSKRLFTKSNKNCNRIQNSVYRQRNSSIDAICHITLVKCQGQADIVICYKQIDFPRISLLSVETVKNKP